MLSAQLCCFFKEGRKVWNIHIYVYIYFKIRYKLYRLTIFSASTGLVHFNVNVYRKSSWHSLTEQPLVSPVLLGGGEGGEKGKEKSGGKSLFSHWQVLCSKAVPVKPVCVIGYRFKEEKEQFVLCWLYKNTLDSMLLASDYSLYPMISMEKNRKTRVTPTFLFLYYAFF